MGVADELVRLIAERDAGELSDEEFEAAKADLLAHPERARTEPEIEEAEPLSALRRRNRRRALLAAALIILVLVGWVVVSEATLGGARLEVRVTSLTTSGDVVAVEATVANVGGRASRGLCEVWVTLPHPGGGTRVVSPRATLTDSPIPPGGRLSGRVEILVASGVAHRVTMRDVSVACR
ncbi:MAG TPA: SHOCT domain-containing protein [Acidimicrobiales bacterium]|nr:SHOCT domain-containing protein [Acidimicrobiales bacterium]